MFELTNVSSRMNEPGLGRTVGQNGFGLAILRFRMSVRLPIAQRMEIRHSAAC
jgi:hypothetical protein